MSSRQHARTVGVNDRGLTIGQDHHNAKLSDHEVDLMRDLRADGMKLSDMAVKFEISKSTASEICSGRWRGQTATDQRTRHTPRRRFRPAHPREFGYVTDHDAE